MLGSPVRSTACQKCDSHSLYGGRRTKDEWASSTIRVRHHSYRVIHHSLTHSERRAIIARPLGKNKGETNMTIRVVCYGLGPIGIGIARLALARAGVQVVGAI